MMDWNELRSEWQRRATSNGKAQLARPAAINRLWRRVRSRDGLESLVAALLVPFFAATALWTFREQRWIPAAFALFLVCAIVYIPWRLWRARRMIPQPDPNRPVREFLVAERAALNAQAGMLRSVARWYYGPIAVGVIGFYTGLNGASLSSLVYAIVVIGLCAFIEKANRSAADDRFDPAIAAIDEQIRKLEENNDE